MEVKCAVVKCLELSAVECHEVEARCAAYGEYVKPPCGGRVEPL